MPTTTTAVATATKLAAGTLPIQSTADVFAFGDMLAKSNIFGIRNPADGVVIAATCVQEKISFLKFKETFHLINGVPAIKAEAMLGNLLSLGGEYEIIERSPDKVSVRFTYKKAVYVSTLTWEDASKEDYVKNSKGGLKDNWSTPRRRMQMMWARAVSDGVRTVCPLATRGSYTPEEVMDFPENQPRDVTPPEEQAALPAQPMPAAPPQPPLTIQAEKIPQPAPIPQAAPQPSAQMETPPMPGVDYTICRAPGQYAGVKWRDVPEDMLRIALRTNSMYIKDGDRAEIQMLLDAMTLARTETTTTNTGDNNGNHPADIN